MEYKVCHELGTIAYSGMNKMCRKRERERESGGSQMLTKRQMDFNIKLWVVCSSGNPSDNSLCAIAIATLCRQWFAGHSSRPRWLSCQHTLSHDAHTLSLRPADKSHLVQKHTHAHLMVIHLSVSKLQKLYIRVDDEDDKDDDDDDDVDVGARVP